MAVTVATAQPRSPQPVIVVIDQYQRLAELMIGEEAIKKRFAENRVSLISILVGQYHISEEDAATACDRIVMPELLAHASGFVTAEAAALRARFSTGELSALISIYQKPVMRKLVDTQLDLARQIEEYANATIAQVAKEMFDKHRLELHRLGIDR